MKKRYILLLMLSLFLIIMFPTISKASEEETDVTSNFKDENLKQAIIDIIKEVTGEENKTNITIGDINTITADNLPSAKQLNLAGKGIKDLTGLELFAGKNIEWIYLDWNEIQDISVLSRFTSLTKISASQNQITDLSSLSKLTKLKTLTITDNQVSSLEPLANVIQLEYLYIDNNQITNLTALSNLTNLQVLSVSGNKISDIRSVLQLPNLNFLDVSRNQVTNLKGITKNNTLTNLNINYNQLTTLQGIENFTNLEVLSVSNNQITDITGIENLKKLYNLNLNANQITDITKLQNMTELQYVYLDGNHIIYVQVIENLSNLEKVTLYNQTYEFVVTEKYEQEDLQVNLTDYFMKLKDANSKLYAEKIAYQVQDASSYTMAQDFSYIIIKQSDIEVKPITLKLYDDNNTYITFTIKQELPQEELTSQIYKIENNFIQNVTANTTVETFKQNVSHPVEVIRNGNALQTAQVVATGDTIHRNAITYTIIVTGDITQDGLVNIFDVMRIKRKVAGTLTLDINQTMAADITGDGKINIMDVMRMMRIVSDKT